MSFVALIAAGLGLAAGLALLIGPVTAVIAGLFLDDVAEVVEKEDYPQDPPGRALPCLRIVCNSPASNHIPWPCGHSS